MDVPLVRKLILPRRGGLVHRLQIQTFLRRSGWTNLALEGPAQSAVGSEDL